jgi:hypothetical protein
VFVSDTLACDARLCCSMLDAAPDKEHGMLLQLLLLSSTWLVLRS